MAGRMSWLTKVHKQGVCSDIAQHCYILHNHSYISNNAVVAACGGGRGGGTCPPLFTEED